MRYQCVLCDCIFALSGDAPALPEHRYPRGLYRGRPCMSRYGIPLAAAVPQGALASA